MYVLTNVHSWFTAVASNANILSITNLDEFGFSHWWKRWWQHFMLFYCGRLCGNTSWRFYWRFSLHALYFYVCGAGLLDRKWVWCDVLNYPAKLGFLHNTCKNRCCSFNFQPLNEDSPLLQPLSYGEDIDAPTCRAEIVWLTLSTVVSVAMASTLNSVTVATTILALMHLLVVCNVVVFTNFL